MGTAPTDRQPPVMPDVHRVLTRSVDLLQRLGLSEVDALGTVAATAIDVHRRLFLAGCQDVSWIWEVVQAAITRAAVLDPSITDREVIEHADGTSSRTGSPEERAAG